MFTDTEEFKGYRWKLISEANHREFIRRANKKAKLMTELELINFLALALCGEAGELANLLKKDWRGDDLDLEAHHAKIKSELADIRIYLHHLCTHLMVDIDEACFGKVAEIVQRLEVK